MRSTLTVSSALSFGFAAAFAALVGPLACSSEGTEATDDTASTGGARSDAADIGQGSDASSSGSPDAGGVAPSGDGSASDPCAKPKPGPTTTGVPAGVTLKKSKSIKVETDGAVVEGLDIDGEITVLANNVTIRNVRITSGDYYPIRYFDNDNTGLVVEDSEIIGTSEAQAAISFHDYTARRLNIHGSSDGLKADSNVLIEDCWIHDLSNGPGEHNDGIQSGGGKGVTIRHNVIDGASNATVQAGSDDVAMVDLTVECNWLDGGGYALNIRGTGATRPKNTRIIGNRFGRSSAFGPWVLDDPSPVVERNVYDDNGEAIPYR